MSEPTQDELWGLEAFNAFSVWYNNITSNQAPGLNPYEVSLIMTRAQTQVLQDAFNHRTDRTNGGYDRSEKRQIDFSSLIRTAELTEVSDTTGIVQIDSRSIMYDFDTENVMFILNEFVRINNNKLSVIPLAYDTYANLMKAPYKFPPKDCAWRLINTVEDKTFFEVVAKGLASGGRMQYIIHYIEKPAPIILTDLTEQGLTIEGISTVSPCKLPKEIWDEIMERAVTLAKIAWQGSTSTLVSATLASNKNN